MMFLFGNYVLSPTDTKSNLSLIISKTCPMTEFYTTCELAEKIGVPWQTILAWKRNGTIPLRAVMPDGHFKKSVIDPLIEAYQQHHPSSSSPPADPPKEQKRTPQGRFTPQDRQQMVELYKNGSTLKAIAEQFQCNIKSVVRALRKLGISKRSQTHKPSTPIQPTQPVMKSKTKKGYPVKVRTEAMRLIFEQHYTSVQVAAQLGCSVACLQKWKKRYLEELDHKSSSPSAHVNKNTSSNSIDTPNKIPVNFDDFARNYWQEGTRAVDVLLLSPEIGPKVLNYVNEALRYAYEKLQ
jgi:transposase-like protein